MAHVMRNQYYPDEVSPPRATLRELIEERNIKKAELARRMGRTSTKHLDDLLNDASDVALTPETALQLERALGLSASFWLTRESAYREARARSVERQQHERDLAWLDCLPLTELRKRGHLAVPRKCADAVREALDFFRVASIEAWELVWSASEVAYRMSPSFDSEIGHLAAWLRCGEIAAMELPCEAYDSRKFAAALPAIRELTTRPLDAIVSGMVDACRATGVAVVLVPEFPKTHVSGAARWIDGGTRPLIQLSLRHKADDHFWFTFFHEAAHILKHPKKPIYLDDLQPDRASWEEEANRFARNLLIPEQDYLRFIRGRSGFALDEIQAFARSVAVAPGIVIGRLQFDRRIPPSVGHALKRKFDFGDDGQPREMVRQRR